MNLVETIPRPVEPVRGKRDSQPQRKVLDLGQAHAGPTLLVVAGLHGNEPAGVSALHKIAPQVASIEDELEGRLVGLLGNMRALATGRRFLHQDLNRSWPRGPELDDRGDPSNEEGEQGELAAAIDRVRHQAVGDVYGIDLHTTSGPGPAFAVLNDTVPNRKFAMAFPSPVVLGLEEELAGTLAGYLSDLGVRVAAFESGQHEEPASVDRAVDGIWVALGAAGLLDAKRPEIIDARRRLTRESKDLPRLVEVRYRHDIEPEDRFRIQPGLAGFQPVAEGAVLGRDRRGPVTAPLGGLLLMPLYQELGEDGFFITRPVLPVWLRLSTFLRRLRGERFLHLLPGVRRHPELANTFVVDRRKARWLALEVFHLLGFRRLEMDDETLTMTRRLGDVSSPTPGG